MSPLHRTLPLVLLLVTLSAGCLGGPLGPGSPTPSATPLPADEAVEFPDGPKERPDRPATLNTSSVDDYVYFFEYRYVYNSLWFGEHTSVHVECEVDSVNETGYGYEAVVTCSGYSNTDVPENSTTTPAPHADWFTQTYRYRVDSNTTLRERVSMSE